MTSTWAPPTDECATEQDLAGAEATSAWTSDDLVDLDDFERGPVVFAGDTGALELAARRALVTLLKHRFITASSHPRDWRALLTHRTAIRARLNDMFLDLHLDTEREVALKRQVTPEGGGRFPTLLHDLPWPREETALLVHLRSRARGEELAGQSRSFVERADLLDHLSSLRPPNATDHKGDTRRGERAIDALNRAGLLVGPADANRYEISPAINVILPVERLTELLESLTTEVGAADLPLATPGSAL